MYYDNLDGNIRECFTYLQKEKEMSENIKKVGDVGTEPALRIMCQSYRIS